MNNAQSSYFRWSSLYSRPAGSCMRWYCDYLYIMLSRMSVCRTHFGKHTFSYIYRERIIYIYFRSVVVQRASSCALAIVWGETFLECNAFKRRCYYYYYILHYLHSVYYTFLLSFRIGIYYILIYIYIIYTMIYKMFTQCRGHHKFLTLIIYMYIVYIRQSPWYTSPMSNISLHPFASSAFNVLLLATTHAMCIGHSSAPESPVYL